MSESDSFIKEVSEEVRRDRFYRALRRYGWIGILIVVLIVGGAAWREYSNAAARAQAQAFGDAILAALELEEPADRLEALRAIAPPEPDSTVVLNMLIASEEVSIGDDTAAVEALRAIATQDEAPEIYRHIAGFKALARGDGALSVEERRIGFEELTTPGNPLRLLAEEQLALIEVETGAPDAAIARLQGIIADSEVTAGLRRRASQLIVALGGELGTS